MNEHAIAPSLDISEAPSNKLFLSLMSIIASIAGIVGSFHVFGSIFFAFALIPLTLMMVIPIALCFLTVGIGGGLGLAAGVHFSRKKKRPDEKQSHQV